MRRGQRAQAADQRSEQAGEERTGPASTSAKRSLKRSASDFGAISQKISTMIESTMVPIACGTLAQVAADQQGRGGRDHDDRDRVEGEDRRQVGVRIGVQARHGPGAPVAVLGQAAHPDPADARQRGLRRGGERRDDETDDDDDDERDHRLGDGGGSEPLTGTVR